jgi:hypothetical protein
MAIPLISVLIPTHNRPENALTCLTSAVRLDFADCEIVLSDNSSIISCQNDIDKMAASFSGDSRFRLIRPATSMNMADHWEWATRQTRGKYLAILTDRHVVRPSMFRVIGDHLATDNPDLVVWNVKSGYSDSYKAVRTGPFDGTQKYLDPEQVLRDYLSFSAWDGEHLFTQNLPRGLNSICSNELVKKIRAERGRMFFPLSPDYTSAYLLLAHATSYSEIDLPFYMSFGSHSNGETCATEGIGRYVSTYPGLDPFDGCPVRIDSVFNSTVRDFLAMQAIEPRLKDFRYDTKGYYLSLYRDLIIKELLGSPMDTIAMRDVWRESLARESIDVQQQVQLSLELLKKDDVKLRSLRKFLYQTKLFPMVRSQLELFRRFLRSVRGEERYDSVLEAVANTDDLLSPVVVHEQNLTAAPAGKL